MRRVDGSINIRLVFGSRLVGCKKTVMNTQHFKCTEFFINKLFEGDFQLLQSQSTIDDNTLKVLVSICISTL